MNNFQTILVAIFLAFFVFAVLIFSGLIKIGGSSSGGGTTGLSGKVVIWGTFPSIDPKVFEAITDVNKDLSIRYFAKNPSTYQQDLLEAAANGTSPDLFFITPDLLIKNKNLIYKVPYASYAQKSFTDSFIDGASIYLSNDGIAAFPLVVDPIVLFYNKNILSNEGISSVPQFWNELFSLNGILTKKKDDGTILQSMIGLGRYENVNHAKDILATLMLQSGNPIVKSTDTGYVPTLVDTSSSSSIETILSFFIEFSNPSDTAYSWNRALPNSLDMFTGGKSAFYLGRASELFKIQSVNPNLSFDVAQILQTKGMAKRTYGSIYAVAVSKKSANLAAALSTASLLSSGDSAKNLATSVSLPPANRLLLNDKPADPYLFTFFNSAIMSRAWVDPNSAGTDAIFNELVGNILSSKLAIDAAINKAQSQMEIILKK